MTHAVKHWAVGLGMAAVALAAALPRAEARAYTYNEKVQTIRVGVLLANRDAWSDRGSFPAVAMADANHSFSYVFQALNARPDIRPYGWDVVNPHARPFLDATAAWRYGLTYNVNNPQRLDKDWGAYWEVLLKESSTEQLSDYDVLYMPYPLNDGSGQGQLTVEDREKLRRAVDGGTILWIDNPSGSMAQAVSGAKLFVTPSFMPTTGVQTGDPMESLLSTPFALSQAEIRNIGLRGGITRIAGALVDGRNADPFWKPVLAVGATPTAAVFPYGQGAVIVTGGAIGRELTRGFRPTAQNTAVGSWRPQNSGPVSGGDPRFISVPDLKFVVNILAYRFQSPQPGGGPRHASGSRQDLSTPLGRKWQYPENFVLNNPGLYKPVTPAFVSDPVVWNGVAYAAMSDGYLRAFDMDPQRDLDGDGNPDDGLPNNPNMPGSDVLWQVQLPGPCSSLVIGNVNGEPKLFGMLADGSVFSTPALRFQTGNGRRVVATNVSLTKNPVFAAYHPQERVQFVPGENQVYRIPAPVFYNGRLFAVGIQQSPTPNTGLGSIAEIDPVTTSVKWRFPQDMTGSGASTVTLPPQSRMGIPSATPTVAAIPDKGYADATDIMLLVPTYSVNAAALPGGNIQPSRILAFPIGVRGERLMPVPQPDGSGVIWETRLANVNAINVDANSVRLWLPGQTGSVNGTAVVDQSRGFNRLGFTANIDADTTEVRADYDFAPGAPNGLFQGYNARWRYDAWSYVLGSQQRFMEILTTPVVSAEGRIYWVASDIGEGGNQAPMVMGVEMREQNLPYDISKNPRALPPLNQPSLTFVYSVGQGAVSGDPCGAPVPQPVVLGTPAVDRGILYVGWGKWNDPTSPASLSQGGVSGFRVRDTEFGLLLQNPVDDTKTGGFSVRQRNRCTGDWQQVGIGQFQVQNISIGNTLHGLLILKQLSSGPGTVSIDLSRPEDIEVSYQAVDPTDPTKSAPVQDEVPQAYYRTMRNEGIDPSVLLAFNTAVPSPTNRGGVRTGITVAAGSIYVGSDDGQVWTVQLPTDLQMVQGGASATMRPATYPSLAASAGYGTGAYPPGGELRATPVVANNTLVQNSPAGLYTFFSPRTLITDNNRVVEVVSSYQFQDASYGSLKPTSGSSVVWSLDATTQTRDYGDPGAGPEHPPWGDSELPTPIVKALNQPTMAIRVNTTNTLVCDTGNNRVVEVDRAGRVTWQCTEFADPYGLLGPNESRTLNSPTSVQRWETYEYDDNRPLGRSVHTLIADYGNNRVLEVVTRYSMDQDAWMNNVLVWVGRGPAGTPYQFYQAQRIPDMVTGSLDFGETLASVTNLTVNSADADLGNAYGGLYAGAVTRKPATPGGSLVILGGANEKDSNGASAAGRVVYFINTMEYGSNPQVFPLARPVFFNKYDTGAGKFGWRITMTDGQNVFDLRPVDGAPGLAQIPVDPAHFEFPIVANQPLGSLQNGAIGSGGYTTGTAMAKRLANGNILMVNQNTGYVFEYSPTAAMAVANSPSPSAADIQQILQFTAPPLDGTSALDRPKYADRLF